MPAPPGSRSRSQIPSDRSRRHGRARQIANQASGVDDDCQGDTNLSKHNRPNIAQLCAHSHRGHGPDVLALRGGNGAEPIVLIGFDDDLGAAGADRAREGNHLDDVRSTTKDPRGVTTTAGLRSPASDPAGAPRSSSTTSPGVSIEPDDFVLA
jgi:hypothetical protein